MPANIYYSQFGEDKIIHDYLESHNYNIPKLIIEIGAAHVDKNSNSRFFIEQKGFNGILIEPQKELFENLKNHYKDLKNVKVLNCLISDKQSEYFFAEGEDPTLNGIVRESNQKLQGVTLKSILDENQIKYDEIGIMSVDTEGYEVPILESIFSTNIFPKIVISESNDAPSRRKQFKLFHKYGYKLHMETGAGFFNNYGRKQRLLNAVFAFLPFNRTFRGVNCIWIKD